MIGRLLGRYEVRAQIGEGGMGVVYRAHDPKLERNVAIKVLSSSLSSTIRTERFEHEVRLAAKLQHPNIVPVHDVGESDGKLYYVMALVEGRTLRERFEDAGQLSLEETLGYACDVAAAIDYAHRHDVVHRDIKPANILLSDGRAMVADFGLAMAIGESDDVRLTRSGVALGTPMYMSPEQAAGAKHLDGRSDIYSLGCVVFEALAGRAPFHGDTAQAIFMGHLQGAVPDLRAVRPDAPLEVARALTTALAKTPDERFGRASELAAAISGTEHRHASLVSAGSGEEQTLARPALSSTRSVKRPTLAAALLAAILGASYFYFGGAEPPSTAQPTIAVMPFASASADDALIPLGIGIAQTLTTQLSTLPNLRIVTGPEPGDTTDPYNARAIAKQLGVSHIVQGSLQEDGGRIQVSVNLVDADATIAWGGVYESAGADLFELQRRISAGLSEAFSLRLSAEQRARRDQRPTENRDAYAEYVQGRAFLERRDVPGNLERGLRLLTSATERDGDFALAHAALAETHWQSYRVTNDSASADAAITAARKAKGLSPDHPYVRYVLAVLYEGTGRTDEAIDELQHALELQPNYDAVLALLGRIHGRAGEVDLAVTYFDRAVDGRPGYWGHYREKGLVLLRNGRYRDAVAAFERVTELQPDSAWGFQQLGVSYHYLGELDLALHNYERSVALAPTGSAYSNIGTIHYRRGNYDEAEKAYREAIAIRPNSILTHGNLGDARRKLGRDADAREAYMRALALVAEALTVNPKDGHHFASRALYEAKLGREPEALQSIGRAVELRPRDVAILHRRAAVLAILHRKDEALDAIKDAVDAGASVSEIREDDSFDSLSTSSRFKAIIK